MRKEREGHDGEWPKIVYFGLQKNVGKITL